MSASVSPPAGAGSGALPLQGLRVVCFESRRSAESSRMIALYLAVSIPMSHVGGIT